MESNMWISTSQLLECEAETLALAMREAREILAAQLVNPGVDLARDAGHLEGDTMAVDPTCSQTQEVR